MIVVILLLSIFFTGPLGRGTRENTRIFTGSFIIITICK